METPGGGPSRLIVPAFLLGFLAVLPSFVIELSLRSWNVFFEGPAADFIRAFLLVALVEETMKFLSVRVFLYNRRDFRRITDGILTTLAAGFGFAFFENIFYTFGNPAALILRGVTSVPLHAVASGILGYYVGLSKFAYKSFFRKGLFIACGLHGFYDFFLFRGSPTAYLALPTLAAGACLLRRLYREALRLDEKEGRSRFRAK
jgi:RsiW-degrading membrane proteinase PrsW (M82 family)